MQVRGYIGTSTSTSGSGSGSGSGNAFETREGKGRDTDRTRETTGSHPDPGPRRCPLLIATCNHSGRIYAGELEADSLNNTNTYHYNAIRIPDDHPGEATPLVLNRVVSWDVLSIHSFTLSIVIWYVCISLYRYTANSRPQTPTLLELE